MNQSRCVPFVILVLVAASLAAEGTPSPLEVGLAPYVSVPVRQDSDLIQVGAGTDLTLSVRVGSLPWTAGAVVDAAWAPVSQLGTSLSLFGVGGRTEYGFAVAPQMAVKVQAAGGYYRALINDGSGTSGGSPWFSGGLGLDWGLAPSWVLTGGADWRMRMSLFDDLRFSVAVRFQPEVTATAAPVEKASGSVLPPGFRPLKHDGRWLKMVGYRVPPLFPVLSKRYDTAGQGKILVHNFGPSDVEQVVLSVEVDGYVSPARTLRVPGKVGAGQELALDLPSLANDKVLGLASGGRLTAKVGLSFVQGGRTTRSSVPIEIDVTPWKTVMWDTPVRMASFASPQEPAVKQTAAAALAAAKANAVKGVNREFLNALAAHILLKQLGLTYAKDPASAFTGQRPEALDTLQFPSDTLARLSGDCDDLTVLWCALLEAQGLETATLSYPGHMFPAFALSAAPEETLALWGGETEFLVRNGRYWVPLEATALKDGFFAAWKEGARQVREQKSLQFTPLREAWKAYPAADYLGKAPGLPTLPGPKALETEVKAVLSERVQSEGKLRIAKLLAEIRTAPEAKVPGLENELGILYAKDGQFLHAIEVFKRAASKKLPSGQVNLGTAYLLAGMTKNAIASYSAALSLKPGNPVALTGLYVAYRIYQDPAMAKLTLGRANKADAELGKRLAALKGTDLASLKGVLVWSE